VPGNGNSVVSRQESGRRRRHGGGGSVRALAWLPACHVGAARPGVTPRVGSPFQNRVRASGAGVKPSSSARNR